MIMGKDGIIAINQTSRMQKHLLSFLGLTISLSLLIVSNAAGQLKYYYVFSGNVAFDSTATRSGGIYIYYLDIKNNPLGLTFRSENLVRLTSTPYFQDDSQMIGEGTLDQSLKGLYTIGDVLPAGLSEDFWTTAFKADRDGHYHITPYTYQYVDVVGGGYPPLAQFVYGRPTGEFKNTWDAVDPNSLKWATTPVTVYQPWNGRIILDTTGDTSGYISGFEMKSSGQFDSDAFKRPNTGPFFTSTPELLGVFANAIAPSQYNLGAIFEPGLSLEEILGQV